jgi:hypothetical protein
MKCRANKTSNTRGFAIYRKLFWQRVLLRMENPPAPLGKYILQLIFSLYNSKIIAESRP